MFATLICSSFKIRVFWLFIFAIKFQVQIVVCQVQVHDIVITSVYVVRLMKVSLEPRHVQGHCLGTLL